MKPNLPIALGAGAISAVVFASATTGPVFMRMALLAIVTLPIALTGFAYSVATALLAAGLATLAIAIIVSLPFAALFALTTVLPMVGLLYLTLLHREAHGGADGAGAIQWYPVGHVVLASCLMGGGIASAALVLATGDGASLERLRATVTTAVKHAMTSGLAGLPAGAALDEADVANLTTVMLNLLPGLSAGLWIAGILMCLWIAAHVALASGQLARPWPTLSLMTYPTGTPLLLAAAMAGVLFLEGVPRLVALAFAGALYLAYMLLGLAIVHHVSRPLSWRNPLLTAVYALLMIVSNVASLVLAVIGLADSVYPLRRHVAEPPAV